MIESGKGSVPFFPFFLAYLTISTRPFLSDIEKKWIVFQLLTALSQIEFYRIRHGDIKCENVMVTSWGWVYLTDFAHYKPVFIPEVTLPCLFLILRITQRISLFSLTQVDEEFVI